LREPAMDRYDAMLAEIRAAVDEDVVRDARHFLAELDADSAEGMWFDAVAESFPSRLDAAIAYVRGVKGAAR